MRRKWFFTHFISILILWMAIPHISWSKTEPIVSQRLSPGSVAVSATISNRDPFFPSTAFPPTLAYPTIHNQYVVKEVKDRVILGIDRSVLTYMPNAFTCTVTVQIKYIDHSFSMQTITESLTINFDPKAGKKYQDMAVFQFKGGHNVNIQVVSISNSSVASYLFLESQIELTHFAPISLTTAPAITNSSLNSLDQIVVQWTPVDSAEEYDLEWTYVDDYTTTTLGTYKNNLSLTYNFDKNATRVTVKSPSYIVTDVFEHGYVLFRVRAVGRDMTTFKQRVNGPWSSAPYSNIVGTYAANNVGRCYIDPGHQVTLNWQYAATYAEEGKRKEVISYFDGSLRNRQTVTLTNTDGSAIIGETIYDHQGRGALQVLPVPDTIGIMKYYANFNKNTSHVSYSREDFDVDASSCVTQVLPMDSLDGAARYYSVNNMFLVGALRSSEYANRYIASAGGYPFTVTEYTPDNTGRIRRQSGVGATHKMNGGHETRYYYGRPDQTELDILFGNNVGKAVHYQKNMVVDANGQVSISYLNASGKVIATAMAGDSVPGLLNLKSHVGRRDTTVNLLEKSDTAYADNSLVSTRSFLVTGNSVPYHIGYEMTQQRFTSTCLRSGICYGCVYDLIISVQDECGNELLHGNKHSSDPTPVTRTIGKISGAAYDTVCPGGTTRYKISSDTGLNLGTDTDIVVTLNPGSYTVTKTLVVNESALDYYTDEYIKQNTCLRPLDSFVHDQMKLVDSSACSTTCESCVKRLGNRSVYMQNYLHTLRMANLNPDSTHTVTRAGLVFDSLVTDCRKPCNTQDMCQAGYSMLAADVSPGGQYARYTINSSDTCSSSDPYSVLNTSGSYSFKTDTNFRHVYVIIDGKRKRVDSLTTDQFVKHWQPQWADLLVTKHPEYCYYKWCSMNSASNDWDMQMAETNSYDTALAKGYLDPFSNDPYFKSGGQGYIYYPQRHIISHILNSYNHYGVYASAQIDSMADTFSLKQFAAATYTCRNSSNFGRCASHTNFDSVGCGPAKDYVWQTFRALYMAEKKHMQDSLRGAVLGCSNSGLGSQILRYPTISQGFAMGGQTIHLKPTSAQMTSDGSAINTSINRECDSNCRAYATYWMRRLKGCHFGTDSANIADALIQVCAFGCDPQNPFGSSTISPANIGAPDASFQAVLIRYGVYQSGICDANLITMPMPYGHDYGYKDNPNSDTCSCYHTRPASEIDTLCGNTYIVYHSTTTESISDSIARPGNYNNALNSNTNCACKAHSDDMLRAIKITQNVPDSQKCEHCISCDSLHGAVMRFYHAYKSVSADSLDTTANFPVIFSSYLNSDLNFNLTYQQYVDFMARCIGDTASDTATLSSYLGYFNTGISSIGGSGSMIPPGDSDSTGEGGGSSELFGRSFMSLLPLPGQKMVDTCACNKVFRAEKIAARLHISVATAMLDSFSATLNNLDSVRRTCHHGWRKDSTTGHWTISGAYVIGKDVQAYNTDPQFPLNVPAGIACTTNPHDTVFYIGTKPSGRSAGLCEFKTLAFMFYERHKTLYSSNLTEYEKELRDTLNKDFFGTDTASYESLATMEYWSTLGCQYATNCTGVNPQRKKCSLIPARETMQMLRFLNLMITNGQLVDNTVKLYPAYPQFYDTSQYLYNDTCFHTLIKRVIDIGWMSQGMIFKDSCGFQKHFEWSFPVSVYRDTFGNYHDYDFEFINQIISMRLDNKYAPDDTIYNYSVLVRVSRLHNKDTTLWMHVFSPDIPAGYRTTCQMLCNEAVLPKQKLPDNCLTMQVAMAQHNAQKLYNDYLDSVRRAFRTAYVKNCLNARGTEKFYMRYGESQFHFTLYYYDQAGNLISTVPPEGVHPITRKSWVDSVDNARLNTSLTQRYPSHTLITMYQYNTLNQLTDQVTPDAGESKFWYDRLGRLVVSQNAEQASGSGRYSYTNFDFKGRILEVGEIAKIFGVSTSFTMTDGISRDDVQLAYWHSIGVTSQITKTYYDNPAFTISYHSFSQQNLRGRVVSTTYTENQWENPRYSTHYSYDIHGNVNTMIQQNAQLAPLGQNYKILEYDYDLVSGKVNQVTYENGEADQFLHKYSYDADNRVISVQTSQDGVIWDNDASYYYLHHGPLARTELGDYKVQGMDYAYTIQGWIKGVNSNTLQAARDIGQDGNSSGVHTTVARDVAGYTLGYFSGDYSAVGGSQAFEAGYRGTGFDNASASLYNGNIRHMVTAIGKLTGSGQDMILGRVFQYDQLNRLANVKAWTPSTGGPTNDNWNSGNAMSYFSEHFEYDGNGNILKAYRHGDANTAATHSGNSAMDSLSYDYYSGTNRLKHLGEQINASWYGNDLDDQSDASNYTYDNIGNLSHDTKEEIQSINWTVYGKVKDVTRTTGSSKASLHFEYDAGGHRVMKIVKKGTTQEQWKYVYYVRDAQGNEMATYEYAINKLDSLHYKDSFMLKEVDMYGSSRLGTYTVKKNLYYRSYRGHINTSSDSVKMDTLKNSTTATLRDSFYSRTLGWKQYEVCNHLGNVLVTLSDRRLQHSSNGTTVDWYEADVTTVQDYYAFGAPMPSRSWKDSITQTHDSCVSCALLKAKMKSYYTTNGDTGMKNKTHIAQYLNSQFGFTQSGDAYFSAIQNCGLLKQWVVGENSNDDFYPYLFDFGAQNQYKLGTGNFTIEAWVNITDTLSTGSTIFATHFDSAGVKQVAFDIATHGSKLQADYWPLGGTDYSSVFSTGHISTFAWHHIAFVRSGSGSSSAYTFYVDGVAKGTGTLGNIDLNGRSSWTYNGMSLMGCYYISKAYSYQYSKLRDVRLYNRALSSTEINNAYSQPCSPDTTNLKLWLPLKSYYSSVSHSGYAEGTYPGSTIKDYSKYGATGTYVKNTSRAYNISWDWTFDSTCFVNGTAICQWMNYSVASGYRFAFNGKEKDDETYGEGDEYDYGARMYDARIGRFLRVDILTKQFAWYTPYQFAGNKPIAFIDLQGQEEINFMVSFKSYGGDIAFKLLSETRIGAQFISEFKNTDPSKGKINVGFDLFIVVAPESEFSSNGVRANADFFMQKDAVITVNDMPGQEGHEVDVKWQDYVKAAWANPCSKFYEKVAFMVGGEEVLNSEAFHKTVESGRGYGILKLNPHWTREIANRMEENSGLFETANAIGHEIGAHELRQSEAPDQVSMSDFDASVEHEKFNGIRSGCTVLMPGSLGQQLFDQVLEKVKDYEKEKEKSNNQGDK